MTFGSYFRVSNPGGGRTRLESLSRDEALTFANGIFKSEGIICEIHEVLCMRCFR
jgi:hypothetical protein